jgi:hypothetical protein
MAMSMDVPFSIEEDLDPILAIKIFQTASQNFVVSLGVK